MIKLVAEDNPDMPISKSLRRVLNIDYVSSNSNLMPHVTELLPELIANNSAAIILVDRVPNKYISDIYEELKVFADSNYPYVYVVPIICSEFIAIQAIDQSILVHKYKWLEIVKRLIDNYVVPKNCPPRTLAYKESFNTYEMMCKLYLNNNQTEYANVMDHGEAYNDIGVLCNLLSKMPLTSYLSGECRVSLYGANIDDLAKFALTEQKKSDELQSIICKKKLDDRWWEL